MCHWSWKQGPTAKGVEGRRAKASSVYRVEIGTAWVVHFTIDHEQRGERRLKVSCFNGVTEPCGLHNLVVTTKPDNSPCGHYPSRKKNRNQFTAPIRLEEGTNRIVVIARTDSGDRVRAAVELKIP